MKRAYIISAAVAVAAALALFFGPRLSSAPPPARAVERPTPVTVAPASVGTIQERIEALGTAFADESALITSTVTERVVAVHFEDNQLVRKGDPIVTLAQQEVRAARDAAVEQLAEHQRELKRLESLLQNQSVSRQAYDQRKTQLRITEQRIKELDARLQEHTIRAPFNGVLGLRRISVGALVRPGDAITTIDDIGRIKLDFTVPETYLGVLRPGAAVKAVSRSLPERAFEGAVASIDTRIEPATRSVLVRAILPNPDHTLRPGMLLTVDVIKNERRTLLIPEDALVPFQRRNFVWVVPPDRGDTPERREVVIGGRLPGKVEVTGGLAAGELVVVRGTDQLRDGARVQIARTWDGLPGSAAAAVR
jgi:membrane fusion protein (multidrug efflux system)